MIEFETPKVWSVLTFCGGTAQAWPVQRSEAAGIGQAVQAIHSILEREYTFTIAPLVNTTDAWLLTGTPACPDGYPKKYTVMAYVMPTTMEVSA